MEVLGVKIYALMRDDEVLGYFVEEDGKPCIKFKDGIDMNNVPYMIRINYKDNLEEALLNWVSSRLLQRDRIGIKSILYRYGINKYDKTELFKQSHASMMKDRYWIAFSPDDKYENCSQRGLAGV